MNPRGAACTASARQHSCPAAGSRTSPHGTPKHLHDGVTGRSAAGAARRRWMVADSWAALAWRAGQLETRGDLRRHAIWQAADAAEQHRAGR
jgi:hypothetical protein